MVEVHPEKQRELALHVLERLRAAGYEALWAGGCVRDQLLGRTPKDYDVATNATPPQVRELFGKRRTLAIGAAFGVVAVVGHKEAGLVEVATFRRDAAYSDGRHPDAVVFSDARDDALRRDFTINGLFFDPLAEQVIDYVDGVADLKRRVVRAIGDPRARFGEDKLRMVRAVRIAAGFSFELDPATHAAIEEMAATIHVVSPERVAQEMRKILTHDDRARGVELLDRTRLLAALVPEVAPSAASIDDAPRWRHGLSLLANLAEPSFELAVAAIFVGLGELSRNPAAGDDRAARAAAVGTAVAVCRRWRLSNKEQDRVAWLVEHHGRLAGAASQPWSQIQPLLTSDGALELVALREAELRAAGMPADDAAFCRRVLALPAEELNPPPLLDGHALIEHGVPQGAVFKWLLDEVRRAQLERLIVDQGQALALVDRLLAQRRGAPLDE